MLAARERILAQPYRWLRRKKNNLLNFLDAPLVVLAYHRVADLEDDPHRLAVTPGNFRDQMLYLRDYCRCLRLDEEWPAGRRPAVAVTFDDGYADNLHQALPILAEAGIPATFFICTGNLGTREEFWPDELERLLLAGEDRSAVFSLEDSSYGGSWPTVSRAERQALFVHLHGAMLKVEPVRRAAWLVQLRRWAGVEREGRDSHRALSLAELRELASSPLVTIGAHGVTHAALSVLPAAGQQTEINGSRVFLEEVIGRPVDLFAYPFGGRRQYDKTTRRICREAGFRLAVTTLPGQVHRWSDPWQLPRQLVRNWDIETFARQMRSFWV